MKSIDELNALAKWMRETGVAHLHTADEGGTVTITLGVAPEPKREPVVLTDEEAAALLKQERARLDELLFASSEGFPEEQT